MSLNIACKDGINPRQLRSIIMPAPTARPHNTKSQQAGLRQLQSLLMRAYSARCNGKGVQHVAELTKPMQLHPAISMAPCSAKFFRCIWLVMTLLLSAELTYLICDQHTTQQRSKQAAHARIYALHTRVCQASSQAWQPSTRQTCLPGNRTPGEQMPPCTARKETTRRNHQDLTNSTALQARQASLNVLYAIRTSMLGRVAPVCFQHPQARKPPARSIPQAPYHVMRGPRTLAERWSQ